MKYFKNLIHIPTFLRYAIILTWLALPSIVQARAPWPPLEAGFTLTPGVSYLQQSQPLPEGLTYRIGWDFSGGFSISVPISSSWHITSGLQIVNFRYVYRLSPQLLRDHLLEKDDTHFYIHPVYLSIPLLIQRAINSYKGRDWSIIIGTRFYQRLRVFDPADNLQDLIHPYKVAVDTGPLYYQHLVSLVGGLGYTHNVSSRWRLQVSVLTEYGIHPFLSDTQSLLLKHFTGARILSITSQCEIYYQF